MSESANLIRRRIEAMRRKLQDTSRRNPLINNVLGARTASFIRIVDEKPQNMFDALCGPDEKRMRLVPLPPLDQDPADEDTQEFKNAFENAKLVDEEYLASLEALDFDNDERAIDKQEAIERGLKDRLRELLELPARVAGDQQSDLSQHARLHGIDPSSVLPHPSVHTGDNRHEDDQLQTLLFPKIFQSRISRIFSKAKLYQEERGLEVVYLALGYLRWALPNESKDNGFKSPLVLIPVTLSKKSSRDGEIFSIQKRQGVIFNPSLRHKLMVDAGLDLETLLERVDDNDNLDIEAFFRDFDALRPKNMHWKVVREAVFGVFPFQGIELFYDLKTDNIDFAEFPIISELMIGREDDASNGNSFSEADIDSRVGSKLVPHIVLDADSSQFLALLKVANGQNVALEGPPGSGKSQTIVNAIANTIYQGKKVLFVAQKTTALEVVYSRLEALGLGSLVLPFMGSHSNSDNFYEALGSRLELRSGRVHQDLPGLRERLHEQRDLLEDYIDLIQKQVYGTVLSVYEVIGLCVTYHDEIEKLSPNLKNAEFDPTKFSASFSVSDIGSASEYVTDWFAQLRSSEIPKDSVWQFSDSNMGQGGPKISQLLATVKRHLNKLDRILSEISPENRDSIGSLSNLTLSQIKSSLRESEQRSLVAEIPLLEDALREKGGSSLIDILEGVCPSLNLIEKLKSQHSCTDGLLREFIQKEPGIFEYTECLSSQSISHIEYKQIEQLEEALAARKNELRVFACLQNDFPRISEICQPNQLIELKKLSENWESLRSLKRQVRLSGLSNVTAELREGRAALRELEELVDSGPVPDLPSVKHVANVLDNPGFLSFLSPKYREAQRKASEWLMGGRKIGDTKLAVDGLRNLQEKIENWRKLSIADEFEEVTATAKNQLESWLLAVKTLVDVADRLSLKAESLFDFVLETELPQALGSANKIGRDIASWEALRTTVDSSENALREIRANKEVFLICERLCQDLQIETVEELRQLTSNASMLRDAFSVRDATVDLLDDRFSDKAVVEEFILAYKQYAGYPEEIRETLLGPSSGLVLREIRPLADTWDEILLAFLALLDAKDDCDLAERLVSEPIRLALQSARKHVNDSEGFQAFLAHHSIFLKAENIGLDEILWALHSDCPPNGEIRDDIGKAVKAAIAHSLKESLELTYGGNLMMFSGQGLDFARKKLQELDRKIIEISPQEVRDASLRLADPPRGIGYGRKSDYTDMALLTHQLGRQRRTPPRKLMGRAHAALMELFPCWMMVPVAVAQNLPRRSLFDLVIIDEASQMTPETSISALMRGQSALIAGDTNQLPPTNFFRGLSADSIENEDEDYEDIATDEDSILELANLQFHPKHRLLWHYRSQHEELIAFSNHYVYDNELVIFPSPQMSSDQLGVSLYQVNGTYQRGINLVEAEEISEAVIDFMKSMPDRSLGVVAMNQSQMEHIESIILRKAQDYKHVQNYIDKWEKENDGLEKFFVKNLENVQGDERDVIFIGTVYGHDSLGKFYQRFGPINGTSGKRRLNVLFSRAKQQIVTFTSIPLAEFHPSPNNEGATLLKRWLEFSATKRLGEVAHHHDRAGHPDSPFEEHVIEAVRSLGYEAVPQVGVSSYFIDIGVKHPKYPFGYICGVECDGATYHSAKSARDRDRLREEVLGRLGWSLYRIWSTDWFRDPLACRDALKRYLDSTLQALLKEASEHERPPMNQGPADALTPEARMSGELASESTESSGDSQAPEDYVKLGSKVQVHYLDGPRAGAKANFWIQRQTDDPAYILEGYRTIGVETPIAQALLDANVGNIVTYQHDRQRVRVGLLRLE